MTCARGCCDSPAEHYRSIFYDRKSAFETEKNKFRELSYFERAVKEGSLPWGTKTEQSLRALEFSDKTGRPFRADNMAETMEPEWSKELKNELPMSLKDNGTPDPG